MRSFVGYPNSLSRSPQHYGYRGLQKRRTRCEKARLQRRRGNHKVRRRTYRALRKIRRRRHLPAKHLRRNFKILQVAQAEDMAVREAVRGRRNFRLPFRSLGENEKDHKQGAHLFGYSPRSSRHQTPRAEAVQPEAHRRICAD